jgi:Ser/Thr protein kinase RdoA (MazF antagonist)
LTPAEAEALAREALAAWGGTGVPRLLKLRENAVFEIALPEIGRAALRLHRRGYQTEDAIRSELWWLAALADEGLAVPRPLVTAGGGPIAHLSDGRIASVLGWVEGAPLGEAGVPLAGPVEVQIRLHASIGRALGALHAATDRLALPAWFRRPRWDADGLVGTTPFWGPFWDHPGATPAERDLLAEVRQAAALRLADYAAAGADQGLIHADVLRENVLVADHHVALIDFDDSGHGFRLYDLGTALSQNLAEPFLPEIATALIEGYATVRPLEPEDRSLLPLFTLLRCCTSVGWMVPRLAPGDPRQRAYLDRALRAARIVMSGGDLFARP